MSEFILFRQVLEEYEKSKLQKKTGGESCVSPDFFCIENPPGISSCSHDNTIDEKGVSVCIDCGEEINSKITHDKEWRYYSQGDSKNISDPNRVQMRKQEDRNIYKDVENLNFSENIVSKANRIYSQVTQGKIFRGNSRRAIVFACVFHAYKISKTPQSHDKLIKIFSLSRKTGLKGLKYVNLYAPRDSKIRTTYITPANLVEEIMEKFSATEEQKKEVMNLYEKIKNKSSKINRARPLSVSSGLVFYWACLTGKEISLKEFAKKVALSELTIGNLAKEVADVLETPNVL